MGTKSANIVADVISLAVLVAILAALFLCINALLPRSTKVVAVENSVCSRYSCKVRVEACGKSIIIDRQDAALRGEVINYLTHDKDICKDEAIGQ